MSAEEFYIAGFNSGYKVARYEPELAASIIKQPHVSSPYFSGLISGKNEYDLEKRMNLLRGNFNRDIADRDVDREKDN